MSNVSLWAASSRGWTAAVTQHHLRGWQPDTRSTHTHRINYRQLKRPGCDVPALLPVCHMSGVCACACVSACVCVSGVGPMEESEAEAVAHTGHVYTHTQWHNNTPITALHANSQLVDLMILKTHKSCHVKLTLSACQHVQKAWFPVFISDTTTGWIYCTVYLKHFTNVPEKNWQNFT